MAETTTNETAKDITADAIALQERDEFCANGWLKLMAPAKVNLVLAIGDRRPDGYHDAFSVMHALTLHDIVYMRRRLPNPAGEGADDPSQPIVRMVPCGDIEVPDIPSEDNLAAKAIIELAEALAQDAGLPGSTDGAGALAYGSDNLNGPFCDAANPFDTGLEVRIEKNIPFEGGLGGASSDAAAALIGAALLWGVDPANPLLEDTARKLGADVAFFLRGGCAYYEGVGDEFIHELIPSKAPIALVKTERGVSTAAAYRAFDDDPVAPTADIAEMASVAARAEEVIPYNNLAHASEALLPELREVRSWLEEQDGVVDALLCGSGATTFALCDDFSTACSVVGAARNKGWWARVSSLSPARAMLISGEVAACPAPGQTPLGAGQADADADDAMSADFDAIAGSIR